MAFQLASEHHPVCPLMKAELKQQQGGGHAQLTAGVRLNCHIHFSFDKDPEINPG